ncbi:uncharacterized protein [Diadema setosum]|uniref:uncharacterized protein n=1 Tax=Diadema setosum TaxID=31175 RepID=UPI003B3A87FA
MLRPIHQMLLLMELLSWSLTLLVFASQQPKLPEAEQGEHYLVWINGSHSATDIRNGTIGSPGFPSMHLSQAAATHTFHLSHHSPRGRIKLDFSDFFLTPLDNFVDCGSPYGDFVKVVDGGSTTVHCGQSRPQPYVSSTHQLVVEYHHASSSNMVTWAPSLFRASYQFLSHAAAVSIREDMAKGYYDPHPQGDSSDGSALRDYVNCDCFH